MSNLKVNKIYSLDADIETGSFLRITESGGIEVDSAEIQNTIEAGLLVSNSSIFETSVVRNTAPAATEVYDYNNGDIFIHTSNATANWTPNFTNLDDFLNVNKSVTFNVYVKQGSPAYFSNSVQIDGSTSNVTTLWSGGSAPSSGNANSTDLYTYNIIKVSTAPSYYVYASRTRYA